MFTFEFVFKENYGVNVHVLFKAMAFYNRIQQTDENKMASDNKYECFIIRVVAWLGKKFMYMYVHIAQLDNNLIVTYINYITKLSNYIPSISISKFN